MQAPAVRRAIVNQPAPRAAGLVLTLVWGLVYLDLCLPHAALRAAACAGLAAFILLSLARASAHIRILCLAVGGASVALTWRSGDWGALYRGMEASTIFGAFMPTLLLLRATAEQSTFVTTMRGESAQWSMQRRSGWALIVSLALSAVLSAGALAVLRPMLPQGGPPEERAELAESAIRGLGLAVCWSPFFVASAVAGKLVPGAAAWQTIVIGLGLAAIGWTVSQLMFFRGAGLRGVAAGVAPLLLPTSACVALIAVTSATTRLRGLEAIVVLIAPVCVAYLALRGSEAAGRARQRVGAGLPGLADEIIIMAVAFILATAVKGLTPDAGTFAQFDWLARQPGLFIAAAVALIAMAGFCGLHPMIGAAILLPLTVHLQRGVADAILAQVVILAWALSSTVAVWSMPLPVASRLFGVPLRRLALGRNVAFVLVFGTCACMALGALNWLLTASPAGSALRGGG